MDSILPFSNVSKNFKKAFVQKFLKWNEILNAWAIHFGLNHICLSLVDFYFMQIIVFFVFRLFSKINSFEMVQNFLENIKTNLIWFIIRKDGVCVLIASNYEQLIHNLYIQGWSDRLSSTQQLTHKRLC